MTPESMENLTPAQAEVWLKENFPLGSLLWWPPAEPRIAQHAWKVIDYLLPPETRTLYWGVALREMQTGAPGEIGYLTDLARLLPQDVEAYSSRWAKWLDTGVST